MDFRNLCQKMNMDGVKAKLPALPTLPAMPTLPQLQFPKALPKLKSRKIFRSSTNDLSEREKNSPRSRSQAFLPQHQQQQHQQQQQPSSLAPSIPPATFINHTPTRISTISSLMHEQSSYNPGVSTAGNTYCSAFSVDDDYPSPRQRKAEPEPEQKSWPTSPIRLANSPSSGKAARVNASGNVHMSLTEKLQKGYKDITEFRMKHIFAKKTVLRKDEIQVNDYVQQFDEERRREQLEEAHHDANIAENYQIKFTLSGSRQNTIESDEIDVEMTVKSEAASKAPTPPQKKKKAATMAAKSSGGDESDMEATTPPPYKPGIAATRFSHVRSPPLKMLSIDDETLATPPPPACNLKTKASEEQSDAAATTTTTKSSMSKLSDNRHMRRLMNYLSFEEEPTKKADAAKSTDEKPITTATSPSALKKKGSTVAFEQETTKTESPAANNENRPPLEAIKQNVKLLQQKLKKHMRADTAQNTDDSDNEGTAAADGDAEGPHKKQTPRNPRWSHLRSFKSTKEGGSDNNKQQKDSAGLRKKLKTWKKSFKMNATEAATTTTTTATTAASCDESSPERKVQVKRSDKLMKKLKYMSTRLSTSRSEQEDEGEADGHGERQHTQKNWRGSKARQMMANSIDEDIEEERGVVTKRKVSVSRSDTESDGSEKLTRHEMQISANQQLQKHQKLANVSSDNMQRERDCLENSSDDDDREDDADADADGVQFDDNGNKAPPAINARRRCFNADYEYCCTEQNQIEQINAMQGGDYVKRHTDLYGASTLTAWTTKPILCQESLDSDTESEFPRVLIHQDHSDAFESTLIIAVTRPTSATLSPHIDEILSHSPRALSEAAEWMPNKEIISGFLASNKNASNPASIRSSTENVSDSSSSKDEPRRQQAHHDPWMTQTDCTQMHKLKKTKTIDIFEANARNGGANAAFEDFDDELRYEPVVKIVRSTENSEHDRSDLCDTTEDDNSSRISNNSTQTVNENKMLALAAAAATTTTTTVLNNNQTTSRGSLIDQISEDRSGSTDEGHDDDEDDDDDDEECFESDYPPSSAPPAPPAPPSSTLSTPPPPIQLRKSSPVAPAKTHHAVPADSPSREYEDALLPPLPTSQPPILEHQVPLPKPSEIATASATTRRARPLVKTASLRLAYNEQVNPDDVGKVNKLISRFETPGKKSRDRPRIASRRFISQDSEECSDYEVEPKRDNMTMSMTSIVYDEEHDPESMHKIVTAARVERSSTPPVTSTTATQQGASVINSRNTKRAPIIPEIITTRDSQDISSSRSTIEQHDSALALDRKNSNCSRSEYGSPLAYSLNWRRSYETTPVPERKHQHQHHQHQRHTTRYSRRSMTKDDDNFYSFDSDEENSYYSISPSDSSRYVVEI